MTRAQIMIYAAKANTYLKMQVAAVVHVWPKGQNIFDIGDEPDEEGRIVNRKGSGKDAVIPNAEFKQRWKEAVERGEKPTFSSIMIEAMNARG